MRGRLITGALVLAGVILIGSGIEGILASDFTRPTGWLVIALAPAEIVLGAVLLFVPLYRRLARDSDAEPGEKD
jgi:hypothetical protein